MDNLMLANIPDATVEILFELEHILLEGSCSDLTSGGIPPRGLQLNLGDAVDPHIQDTLVMSNLGYFQLKANPGVWKLQLGDGRASEIYRIVQTQDGTKSILLTSFNPKSHILKVEKQPGKKDIPLFEEDTASNGMWDSFTNLWGKPTKAAGSDETINVFSLASGHLYERFLKIMMLSVVKNTNSPVKFWLLKNFLSPSFKARSLFISKQCRAG
jgi:UDP-glucose:glycoprotein glucosyltransferase